MRINSGTIGMGSDRSYISFSGRVRRFTIIKGRQKLTDGTGNDLSGNSADSDIEEGQAQGNEKEKTETSLKATFDEMRSRTKALTAGNMQNQQTSSVYEQLKEIRQQCLNYLMRILFPDRNRRPGWAQDSSWQSQSQTVSTSNMLISSFGVGTKTFNYSTQYYHEERETTKFTTQGTVKCADGREISFNLNMEMSRSFQEYYEENISYTNISESMCDPLVINLDGNIADLSDQTFLFDLDGDGKEDKINRLKPGSGFLALDKNGDGTINDGSELFGTKSGNGFADLAEYDTDHNGFIDEGDEIWDKLKIWVTDEDGNEHLYSLAEKGIGAICLQNAATDFAVKGENNQTNGMIRKSGFFLYENGNAGTVQHVDLALHEQNVQMKVKASQSKYEQWTYAMAQI